MVGVTNNDRTRLFLLYLIFSGTHSISHLPHWPIPGRCSCDCKRPGISISWHELILLRANKRPQHLRKAALVELWTPVPFLKRRLSLPPTATQPIASQMVLFPFLQPFIHTPGSTPSSQPSLERMCSNGDARRAAICAQYGAISILSDAPQPAKLMRQLMGRRTHHSWRITPTRQLQPMAANARA